LKKFDRRLKDRDLALNPMAAATLRHSLFASRFDPSASHGVYLKRYPLQLLRQRKDPGQSFNSRMIPLFVCGFSSLDLFSRSRRTWRSYCAQVLITQLLRSQLFANGRKAS
jgi:hypothetical protein